MSRKLLDTSDKHWARSIAEEVVRVFPDLDIYTVSAGISPSGVVHFGNFRDIVTSNAVRLELEKMGKKVRFIFVWDELDRFRKVPAGVDASYVQYIGLPLVSVPDPSGEYGSWAERYEKEFEASMKKIGVDLEYLYQKTEYDSGEYDDEIKLALQSRERIADVLLSNMSDKGKEEKEIDDEEYKREYYPISVYSRFTGKDSTKVLNYDGENLITYRCLETGKEETIDITKDHVVKLSWKVDWAMRWKHLGVVFEPAGKDHGSPGGSYDVSSEIKEKVYGGEPPLFIAYEFIGIRGLGAKMSGSKGNSISPAQLLEIYEAPLLMWLYLRKLPTQRFDLAFDSEVIRQYAEFDSEIEKMRENKLCDADAEALKLAGADVAPANPLPFRQAIAFGQIVQWDADKVGHMLKSLDMNYDKISIESRLKKAKAYLEKYQPGEIVRLLNEKNNVHASQLSGESKSLVETLREVLAKGECDIAKLEVIVYDIPKRDGMSEEEKKKAQRDFFKNVYQLLIGKDTGPRLSTFLWAVDRAQALRLLDI
jgi:lysyl-tRNA synthetase class 1